MTAKIIRLPSKGAAYLEEIVQIGFTGEPSDNELFSEELQEQLLYLLDAEFFSDPMLWLSAIVQVILSSETLDLTPAEALEFWCDEHMNKITLDESEQFA